MKIRIYSRAAVAGVSLLLASCAGLEQKGETPAPSMHQRAALADAIPEERLSGVEAERTGRRKPVQALRTMSLTSVVRGPPPRLLEELRIHVLPVGTGSCQIVECPGARALPMLIDCGSKGSAHFGLQQTRDYIQSVVGDNQVHVIVSHPDDDHVNWVPEVLDPEQVRSLWIGDTYENQGDAFLEWMLQILEVAGPRTSVYDDLPENWHNEGEAVAGLSCGLADTYVLGVNNGTDTNTRSLMLAIQYGAFSVTFTGDATKISEAAAIANFPDALQSTVMLASHHGADTADSNHLEWVMATQPSYVIYSAGNHAGYRHPRCAAAERYREFGALLQVSAHDFQCGVAGAWRTSSSTTAEYTTFNNGLVVVTAKDNPDEVEIYCDRDDC